MCGYTVHSHTPHPCAFVTSHKPWLLSSDFQISFPFFFRLTPYPIASSSFSFSLSLKILNVVLIICITHLRSHFHNDAAFLYVLHTYTYKKVEGETEETQDIFFLNAIETLWFVNFFVQSSWLAKFKLKKRAIKSSHQSEKILCLDARRLNSIEGKIIIFLNAKKKIMPEKAQMA